MRVADVIVVGAGVVGCAVADALARRGATVLVVERDHPGAHASSVAAGMLAPLTESEGEGPMLELGYRALEAYPHVIEDLRERSGIDPEFVPCGVLRVTEAREADRVRDRVGKLSGYGVRWVERDELRAREPGLAPTVVGASWSPGEAQVDPALLVRALLGAALRGGCKLESGLPVLSLLREGDRIRGVRTADGVREADEVVICAGPWSGLFEESLRLHVPVEPIRGQLVELEGVQGSPASILWGEKVYLVPRRDGTLLVGATMERVGFDARVTVGGVASLLDGARAVLPGCVDYRFRAARAALRPSTPDHLPLVGPVPGSRGAWLATGHHRSGILLGPLTGELLADRLLERRTPTELIALDPARFTA